MLDAVEPLMNSLCCICLNTIGKGEKNISNIETRMKYHVQCWLDVKEKELEFKTRRKSKCKNKTH